MAESRSETGLRLIQEFSNAGLRSDVADRLCRAFHHHGLILTSADDLRRMTDEELLNIPGIKQARLREIRAVYPYRPRKKVGGLVRD